MSSWKGQCQTTTKFEKLDAGDVPIELKKIIKVNKLNNM